MIHNFRSMPWYQRRSLALATEVDMVPSFVSRRSPDRFFYAGLRLLARPIVGLFLRSPKQTTGHCTRRLTETVDLPSEMRIFVLRIRVTIKRSFVRPLPDVFQVPGFDCYTCTAAF